MNKSFKIFIAIIIISTATAGWLLKKKRKPLNDVSNCRLEININIKHNNYLTKINMIIIILIIISIKATVLIK